jgi:hypothetical protein
MGVVSPMVLSCRAVWGTSALSLGWEIDCGYQPPVQESISHPSVPARPHRTGYAS